MKIILRVLNWFLGNHFLHVMAMLIIGQHYHMNEQGVVGGIIIGLLLNCLHKLDKLINEPS